MEIIADQALSTTFFGIHLPNLKAKICRFVNGSLTWAHCTGLSIHILKKSNLWGPFSILMVKDWWIILDNWSSMFVSWFAHRWECCSFRIDFFPAFILATHLPSPILLKLSLFAAPLQFTSPIRRIHRPISLDVSRCLLMSLDVWKCVLPFALRGLNSLPHRWNACWHLAISLQPSPTWNMTNFRQRGSHRLRISPNF